MLRFIICDDDSLQLTAMAELTHKWARDRKIAVEIKQFSSSVAVLEEYSPEHNDILLLDVIMPEIDGLKLAQRLRKIRADFHIIYMTSTGDFALEAYDVHPYAYLLKPVSYTTYSATLDMLMQKIRRYNLIVQSGYDTYNLSINEISFVEATNRQVVFNMKDGRSIATRDTLTSIQKVLLKYPAFFKPHRSYIINLQYVEHFNTKEISMKRSEALIPIARGLDKDFKDKYFKFMFSD